MITPLLDPVVASKIVFVKSKEELEKYIDQDSLPIIITGDKSKPAMDDLPLQEKPKVGHSVPPADEPRIKMYWNTVNEYEQTTKQWADNPSLCGTEDALNRLKLGQMYRLARVKAEKVMRGETSYHIKGLIRIDENDRLFVNYNTRTWKEKDITEWV